MSEYKWCPHCKTNREAKMDINWIIFVILLIIGVILGLIYLLYCHYKKRSCAVCKTPAALMEMPKSDNNNVPRTYCAKCGEALLTGTEFCNKCGSKVENK